MKTLPALLLFAAVVAPCRCDEIEIAMAMARARESLPRTDAARASPGMASPLGASGGERAMRGSVDPWRLDFGGIDSSKPFRVAAGVWHRPEPNEVLTPGNHWHYCHACDLIQQHSDDNFGDRAAHRCPGCGEIVFDRSSNPGAGRGGNAVRVLGHATAAAPRPQIAQPVFVPAFQPNCPSGNCPNVAPRWSRR